jgi:hypothetical protein
VLSEAHLKCVLEIKTDPFNKHSGRFWEVHSCAEWALQKSTLHKVAPQQHEDLKWGEKCV